MKETLQKEGVKGLFRGLGPPLLASSITTATIFGSFHLEDSPGFVAILNSGVNMVQALMHMQLTSCTSDMEVEEKET